MSRGIDAAKSREWRGRFKRYRASGLTIGRFCADEGVSVNTFYYWSRRVGPHVDDRSTVRAESTTTRQASDSGVPVAMVCFRFSGAMEVMVPAHCLEAIRCLADSAREPRSERAGAFRQVVVSHRS